MEHRPAARDVLAGREALDPEVRSALLRTEPVEGRRHPTQCAIRPLAVVTGPATPTAAPPGRLPAVALGLVAWG